MIQFKNQVSNSNIGTALRIADLFNEKERIETFDIILEIAIADAGHSKKARDIVRSISIEWLLANIEKYAQPILDRGYDFEYWQLLDLCSEIDPDLTQRVAERAAQSQDEAIREAGEHYLN
ncbi:hypothetical protein EON83_27660 [bacterium]|nr:MAG: hypothetical protein EON83_27660 [bacterium]